MNYAMNTALNLIEPAPESLVDTPAPRQDAQNRVLQCMAAFQKHQCAGEVFALSSLSSRGTGQNKFYVFRARSAESDLVIKICRLEQDSAKFQREILAQTRLFEHFSGFADLAVPALCYTSADHRFFVMKYVAGLSAHSAIRNQICVEDEDVTFFMAGKWLGEMHRIRAQQAVVLQHDEHCASMAAQITQHARARNGIYKAEELRGYLARLAARAGTIGKNGHNIVLGHGDFHGGNLIFSHNRCTAIDFFNVRRMFAGSDIARFLVHADLCQYEASENIGQFGLVQSHQDAFFDGYGMTLTSDHPVGFFIRLRLLETWLKISAADMETSGYKSSTSILEPRVEAAFAGL